jgi:Lrp/AsnC family leucine-responsive transcriptional regulator
LQADARISNLKLAEAVALSPTAVLARVQRLTREGYILGYEARLNPAQARTRHDGVRGGAAGPHHAQRLRAVQGGGAGPGRRSWSATWWPAVSITCSRPAWPTWRPTATFAGTVLWQLPGVRETRTYPVMEEVKNSTRPAALTARVAQGTMAIFSRGIPR